MDLFSFLGVDVQESFLDKEACDLILNEIRIANKAKAEIYQDGQLLKDSKIRNTFKVKIAKDVQQPIIKKIKNELQPRLEKFFKMKFTNIQPLEFLSYEAGNFFLAHKDVIPHKNKRKVSVVVFLNQQSKKEGEADYGGGDLCLYGLRKNAPEQRLIIPSQKGLMVAFKSDVLHEVTPVEWGKRSSLVIWFEG